MLELKLVKKESLFPNVLEAILDLTHVANLDCSSTGLKLQAIDTERFASTTILFPAEDFQHYHCDERITMGIAIDDMVKAIRCADKDDNITFKIGDENLDTITISFQSPKANNTIDLRLVGASSQRLIHIPDLQVLDSKCQAFVQMPSAEFMRACKFLSNIGGDGHISVTEKGLKFFATGKSARVNIKYMQPEEATATVVTMQAPVSVALDLKYMNSSAKVSTLFNQVKICLSTTQPLMVECKIGRMGYIRYFLAAKVKPEIKEEEIKGSVEEKEGSIEIKGSGEDKEGIKENEDEGIKEREGKRSKRKRRRSKKRAKIT